MEEKEPTRMDEAELPRAARRAPKSRTPDSELAPHEAAPGVSLPEDTPAAPITGAWTIELAKGVDLLQLTLSCMLAGGGRSSSSLNLPLAALPGLSLEALLSEGAQVHFKLVRSAGELAFEGHVSQGRGGGSFVFEVSSEFVEGMQSLGYESLTVERLFTMAVHDINQAFVRELSALGYERVPVDQLVEMSIHGVSTKFVQELQALGDERPPVQQLIDMRIHGVRPDLIRQLQELGYRVPVDQLVEMRIHGLSTKFVQESRTNRKSLEAFLQRYR